MTDLLYILPSFPLSDFAALLPAIERQALTTTDLLLIHPADLAKRTQLPIIDLRRLLAAIHASLSNDLAPSRPLAELPSSPSPSSTSEKQPHRRTSAASGEFISTLDDGLDAALGGGVLPGHITEFTGESGVGKTQFLLSLCLAVQLPPPRGLGKQALYIATESGLETRRLAQMLEGNPILREAGEAGTPASLDGIHSAVTPDLESQDHILEYQVPVLLSRHEIGLVIIDSVAANYRAEFERQGSSHVSNMAIRSAELIRLGALLRNLARRHNVAVVVANQVADRFASSTTPSASRNLAAGSGMSPSILESPLAARSMPPPSAMPNLSGTPSSPMPFPFSFPGDEPPTSPTLALDHQQRWFTGWGDDPRSPSSLKTPSLGLVWSTQISCRIALCKRPVYGRPTRVAAPISADDDVDMGAPTLKTWRRWMKVVFAPHVAASGQGMENATEYEVTMAGLKSVKKPSIRQAVVI
ncbi:DNA repair protein RAD57 [Trichoderma cornu-damae]|uniref:DNA repair protein RAD57 n=1 Tax=Trichoderma cornu-damae TaxID=654480 RepID=A0A9P8QKG8_9HYPO|nr:DNA repair protein RAD57 [Trichoderma cornu-damae]